MASDAMLLVLTAFLAFEIRFYGLAAWYPPTDTPQFSSHSVPFLVATPLMMASMIWAGLYRARRDQRFIHEAIDIVRGVTVGLLLAIAATTLLRNVLYDGRNLSRLQFALYGGTAAVLLMLWRYGFRTFLRLLRAKGWNLRHVAIIGTGRLGQIVARTFRRNSWTGIKPAFFISHQSHHLKPTCAGLPVRGGLDQLEAALEAGEVSGVIIALPSRFATALPEVLARLERFPVYVRIVPDMNPKHMPMNMAASELDGMPILSLRESPLAGWGNLSKRTLDIVGSALAMGVFALPMLFIAVAIRLSGPGPVIFRQERMSLNGQRFKLFKFRTMRHVDTEALELVKGLLGTDAWTKPNDSRVTGLGRFLRRTSLDELPQLLNVFLGEMSLVGPRPERPELIQKFREDWRGYMLRQNVKAGITGWAQINGLRGHSSLKKRLQYDLFYIRNWSLMFDLRILGLTLVRGFVHPNAH